MLDAARMLCYPHAFLNFLPASVPCMAGIHFEGPRAAAVNRCSSDVSLIPQRLLNVLIVWLASSSVGSGNRVNRSGLRGGPSTFSVGGFHLRPLTETMKYLFSSYSFSSFLGL